MTRLAGGLARGLAYTLVAAAVLVLLLAGAAGIWLPNLEDYKPEAERLLSEYLGQEIAMASLSAEWNGINLAFKAGGVRVAVDDHPGSGMRFGEIFVSFHPLSLLGGRRTFDRLELKGATIEVARLADGRFRVGDTIIGTPRGLVRRLLQGRNLEITDGTLVWRDALAPGEEMQIEDLHLRIRPRGERRSFELTATAPADLLRDFSVSGGYDPKSLKAGAWAADVNVSVAHLNLSRIPSVIREQLPWQSHGYIDTDIHTAWTGGVLTAATADVAVHDFIIPYTRDKKPLSARSFTSSVSWRRSEDDWRLVFSDPEILLDETPVSVSRFELRRRDEQRTYLAWDANVRDLLGVVNRLDIELPWKALIDSLHPRGVFSEAALTLNGPYLEAEDWRFEGVFRNVGWRPQERYPGIQGLDGRMTVDDQRGKLAFASKALELDAAHSTRGPLGFDRVEGNIEWHRWGRDWVVDVSDGVAANEDMSLTDINFYTRIPETQAGSPFVLARFRVEHADVSALRDYLPVKRMSDKQVEWLDRALAAGRISQGRVYLKGSLDEFPYQSGTGELRASARISDGVLDFHEEWPNLTGLDGVIELDNSRFEARADRGVVMNSAIRDVRAWSDDFFRRDRLLHVQGDLRARADDVVQFLRRGPLNKNPPPAHSRMTAQGEGDLSLAIELPFTRLKQGSRVKGEYVFEDAVVEVMNGVEFTAVSGTVHFTESTVRGTDLEGTLFDGPVRADLTTVEAGRPMTFALSGSGQADVSHLTPVLGPALVSRLQGRTQWEGRFVGGPGPNRLEVRSNLAGVDILVPDPLWKPAAAEALLEVRVEFDREQRRIDLDLEDRMSGELHYAPDNGRPALVRGVLNLGAGRKLPESGLSIAVKDEYFDMDRWVAEVNALRQQTGTASGADPERGVLADHLRSLDVDASRFRYQRRNLGPVAINATSRGDEHWTVRFTGPRLRGTGDIRLNQSPARYSFEMSRLYWPRLENVERATTYKSSLPEPSEFAYLAISAEDFRYGDMRLGRLMFEGAPGEHMWRIRELSLQQPEFTVDIKGGWSSDQFGAHRSRVEISAESDHLGDTLAHLGLANQVASGKAALSGDLSWPGEPGDFSLSRLNGELSFNAGNGRFLNLEPGSGRLLGLFNAETLVRRLTLDFTDVFNEGLAFDRIDGKAKISMGQLQTDGIFIIGPAAWLELSGTTSLDEETYDLGVMVAPHLGGNLSLAGAIANPAAGAVIFVVQKVFKKQMAKLINYKYRVTGDWDDPQVEFVKRPARDMTDQMGRNQP